MRFSSAIFALLFCLTRGGFGTDPAKKCDFAPLKVVPGLSLPPGKTTLLVAAEEKHFEALRKILSDPKTMESIPLMVKPGGWTLEDIKERYRDHYNRQLKHRGLSFVILDRTTNQVAGSCGFNSIDWTTGTANFGRILQHSYWGTSTASDATLSALDYGFNELGLQRIEVDTTEKNMRSRRFWENLGVPVREIKEVDHYGTKVKTYYYEIAAAEWPQVRIRLVEKRDRK